MSAYSMEILGLARVLRFFDTMTSIYCANKIVFFSTPKILKNINQNIQTSLNLIKKPTTTSLNVPPLRRYMK